MRIYSYSLGCPKNRVDTEHVLGALSRDVCMVEDIQEAEVVFINTCAFIQPAVEESIQVIMQAVADVEDLSTRPLLAVTGCLVSRYGEELAREIPEVDLWLPLSEQPKWPELIRNAVQADMDKFPFPRILSTPPGYGYLKISEGCDHSCAFCIIPRLRGRLKSRPAATLVEEARQLLDQGVKEIILVAQDVTAYGKEVEGKSGLIPLLEKLLPLTGLQWLRLLYLYPAGLNNELLSFLAECPRPLLPYFDIPLQHAHPDILQSMGRPFAKDPYRIVEKVREAIPGAILRTSLIVGYPGEKEEHFQALCDFVRKARFHNLGVFPYYPEPESRAASFSGQVEDTIKEARRRKIMEIQSEISGEYLDRFVGEEVEVLVDVPHPEWPGLFEGRTWFQAPEVDGITYISGPGVQPGEMTVATINESKEYDLVALT